MSEKEQIDYLKKRLTETLNAHRVSAAIAAMQGLLSNPATPKDMNLPRMAVVSADDLIGELLRGQHHDTY